MGCIEWGTKIDLYVDGELAAAEAKAFEQHLAGCSFCLPQTLYRLQLKKSVQRAGQAFTASPEFRRKIRVQTKSSGKSANWLLVATSALLLILVAAVSVLVLLRRSEERQLTSEVIDLHVSNLASSNPVDVISTDRHTVKPWFQGKLPFTFDLPELAGTSFQLVGGRLVFVHGHPTALLLFQHKKHFVSVFVFQENAGVLPSVWERQTRNEFHLESWTNNDLRFVLITDASSEAATQLATLLKSPTK